MAGFVTEQEEIKGSSPYAEFKFEDIGDKITFLMVGKNTRNSQEWGEFNVAEVVQFDPDAKSIEAAVKGAKLRSFALPTVLNNQVDNGLIVPGECYTVEFVLDRGDKYTTKDGKTAKSKAKHFKVMRLGVPTEGIQALQALVPSGIVRTAVPLAEPTPETPEPSKRPRV